jgi:hypothetical protein
MKRLAVLVAITCSVLAVAAARAKTLDDLKAELAAKKADVAKLERRIRQMEGQAPAEGGCRRFLLFLLLLRQHDHPPQRHRLTMKNWSAPSNARWCAKALSSCHHGASK